MKKSFLIGIVLALCMVAGLGTANAQVAGEGFNEKIQSTFFGASFGASRNAVKQAFAQRGFYPDENSTDVMVHFKKRGSDRYSFGDMNWDKLCVGFSNNRFYCILFYKTYGSWQKTEALSDFNLVLNKVSAKYNLFDYPLDSDPLDLNTDTDDEYYKLYVGISKDGQQMVRVNCRKYSTVNHGSMIGVFLEYTDSNYQSVSDEL